MPLTSDTNLLNSDNSNSKSELTVLVRGYFVECPFIVRERLILHIAFGLLPVINCEHRVLNCYCDSYCVRYIAEKVLIVLDATKF
jgi:hypothetical protein